MRGSVTLAALVETFVVALVVLAPCVIVGVSLAENAKELLDQGKRLVDAGPPNPPAWVGRIPLVGERADAYWSSIAHDSASLMADLKQYVRMFSRYRVFGASR